MPHPDLSKPNLHTFVILAYRESQYLETCIKSIMRQTSPSTVILATTTLNPHIKRLAKKYNLPIKTTKHTTIGGDFDFALGCGKTELVTIAHQDDTYDPDYTKEIISAYKHAGKRTQIIFSDYYEIRGRQKIHKNTNLRLKRFLLTPLKFRFLADKKWAKRFVLRFGNSVCCPAVTFNTRRVTPPIFASNMVCNVDWLAWEKLSKKPGKFIFINRPLMGHRIHSGSETTKTIEDDNRSREDFEMYRKFWPASIAKKLTKIYKNSEKSNKL